MVSKALVTEFMEAVREEYGKELSCEDAELILSDLTQYFDTLAKIDRRMRGKPNL